VNLVTGATGIVGSHVVLELLQRNQRVVATKQKNSNLKQVEKLFSYYTPNHKQLFEKIIWVELDVCDIFSIEDALEGISTVYHCAGFVSFNKSDRKKLKQINETGTANVVIACMKKKIDALCHVSSLATINNLDYTLPLHEGVFWKASGKESDYALSKYNAEREVWRGIEEGLHAVIVNPGIILSPGFWQQSSSQIFDTCYNGNKFYTNGMGSYISANDVAKAMIELTQKRLFSNRYILIENSYSYRDIFNQIHTHLGKPLPTIQATRLMLEIGKVGTALLAFFSGKKPKITRSIINSALNKQIFSNKKLKEALELPLSPIYLSIDQICKQYLAEKSNQQSSS
jgi:dihydroflavonol-4-reductase